MKFQHITKQAVSELLFYLAEKEEFSSVKKIQGINKKDVVEILKEIAVQLKNEMADEGPNQKSNAEGFNLSPKALSLVSCLSPREELLLFKSFKII